MTILHLLVLALVVIGFLLGVLVTALWARKNVNQHGAELNAFKKLEENIVEARDHVDLFQTRKSPDKAESLCGRTKELGTKMMICTKSLMKKKNLSRDHLIDFLSERRSRPVSRSVVNMWFTETKPHHWPQVMDMILICEFLKSPEPLNEMLKSHGWRIINQSEQELLKVAEIMKAKRKQEFAESSADRLLTRIVMEEGGKWKS